MAGPVEFAVSREAIIDARLFDGVHKLEDESPVFISLFQANAAAVRAVSRAESGSKVAALVVVNPPLAQRSDEELIALTRDQLVRKLTAFLQGDG